MNTLPDAGMTLDIQGVPVVHAVAEPELIHAVEDVEPVEVVVLPVPQEVVAELPAVST